MGAAHMQTSTMGPSFGPAVLPIPGYVMVPTDGMMPPPGIGMPPPAPVCMPDYVPVPMDRFARWPQAPTAASSSSATSTSLGGSTGESAPEKTVGLTRSVSNASSIYRVRWTVDARKLRSTDREAVSPPFELSLSPVQFKMVMRPKASSDGKGGSSFKKSGGRGTLELRCLSKVDTGSGLTVKFRVAIGSGSDLSTQEAFRGPVRHDFAEKPICGLPEGQEEWDFARAVDQETQTFTICLENLMSQS
eukprot:gnl/TRDRNA2_/TRDRNA2_157408_c4_seq5.p1 gnl/TRDRNA2_/TRDRNA2_157408_c4~~gnl/TRDRNA2_/TRDRNA2_157408_c4_seq5.p1  ORF type:complete len:274 (-),score=42.22 gnl/TRDRNA2_/TRDRNA2_157408_c4_seq5:136-876(-)